jgi:hypothetical protein
LQGVSAGFRHAERRTPAADHRLLVGFPTFPTFPTFPPAIFGLGRNFPDFPVFAVVR